MNRNSNFLTFFLVFTNVATIVLYLFPPIEQENHNVPFVAAYLLLSAFLIYVGLKRGLSLECESPDKTFKVFTPTKKFINFVFVFYSLTFLIKYGYLLGFSPLDIPGMVGRLLVGIADPQLGYKLVQEREVSSVHWSTFFLISLINQLFFVFVFVIWKNLSLLTKILGVLFIIIELFFWAGTGTGFGVITMFTNIVFVLMLVQIPAQNKNGKRYAIAIGVLLVFAVVFFSYNINGRAGGDSEVALNSLMNRFVFDEDSFILLILPESLWSSYYYIYSYVCQGYEALGCVMDLPMAWTAFCGNNPTLMSFVKFLFGYDAFADSYMVELEKTFDIDSLAVWHSAYLWWANDFTLWGTLIIVYLISYLCGYAFVLGFQKEDVLSRIVFVVLGNMILFLFANNTYLANVFYSFMFVFPYWLITRVFKTNNGDYDEEDIIYSNESR